MSYFCQKLFIMKKILFTIISVAGISGASAQTDSISKSNVETEFNKWSIEFNGGVNKPQQPFAPGYYTGTPSPFSVDFGVRYMFNNKFGLKGDVGYNILKSHKNSAEFKTEYYRTSLQGVANLGRIMNFETWTSALGLLLHAGPGYAQFQTEGQNFTDRMGTFNIGFTGQLKLSNTIALTGDFTSITNISQSRTFDGTAASGTRGFGGGIFTGTVGLTIYLGKHTKHADWFAESDKYKQQIEDLQKRIGDVETMMNDLDRDGVPDYLDAEPNTLAGASVDSRGRANDLNNNGVPDQVETYVQNNGGNSAGNTGGNSGSTINNGGFASNNELVRNLINDGYVTTYFDYNKSTPTNISTEGIDFILTYLRNNPTASVDIIGHADELGRTEYNDKLSTARANSVKNILVRAKIDASRLNIVPAGEDTSVDKNSDGARKLVRRVTFKVK